MLAAFALQELKTYAGSLTVSASRSFSGQASQLRRWNYPLVKGYLRNQLGVPNNDLKLVVTDAAGVREPCLCAATMKAVLQAHEKRISHVVAAYRLVFDREVGAYRVKEASV